MLAQVAQTSIKGLSRQFYYSLPTKTLANGKIGLVVALHGATGNGYQYYVPDSSVSKLVQALNDRGYAVIAPDAREDFFNVRWESENDDNVDIDFIRYLLTDLVQSYNDNLLTGTIDTNASFLLGGSSGAIMTSRCVSLPGAHAIIAGAIMVNGCGANQVLMDYDYSLHFTSTKIDTYVPVFLINSVNDSLIPVTAKIEQHAHLYKDIGKHLQYRWNNDEKGKHNWDTWVEEYYPDLLAWFDTTRKS